MSVPKGTTPRPFSSYRNDETPAWVEPVRRDTPGYAQQQQRPPRDYGRPARKTMAYKPKFRPDAPAKTLAEVAEGIYLLTREQCWDCKGDGKSGAILYRCPVCGMHYTWASIEANASQCNRRVRDDLGAYYLPCSDRCMRIPSTRLFKIYESCPTCEGRGYLDELRNIDAIAEYVKAVIYREMGIANATLPTPAMPASAFHQSEPTAPAAPLEHPAVRIPERFTPTLNPLAPDEF